MTLGIITFINLKQKKMKEKFNVPHIVLRTQSPIEPKSLLKL